MAVASISAAIDRVKGGETSLEVIWQADPNGWPLIPTISSPEDAMNDTLPLRISILDSSFNPPTLAHRALATSRPPLSSNSHAIERDYDARLLLLSVTNADKALKPSDATFLQRVEMVILLAKAMIEQGVQNIAVAVIDEPSFVGKSSKILRFLHDHPKAGNQQYEPRLTFILGTDTVTRFFASRYYASEDTMRQSISHFFLSPREGEGGDGSSIACARRASDMTVEEEEAFLNSRNVKPYVDGGGIGMLDIGATEAQMSSTKVRAGVLAAAQAALVGPEWEAMCPVSICQYINEQGLYKV